MTTEERFERIAHVTAGLEEERRKEREESRTLWRDTQRHIDGLATKIVEVDERLGARIEEVDRRLGERIASFVAESRAADQHLGERELLVSAMGEFVRGQAPPR